MGIWEILERVTRRYAAWVVGLLATGAGLIVLMVLVVPLAILIFAIGAVLFIAAYSVLGEPGPPLGSALGIGWFVGSLVVLSLILRRGHRWLRRFSDVVETPARLIDPDPDMVLVPGSPPPVWAESAGARADFEARVRTADATLADEGHSPDGDPRG